ncbi:MAG TPA: PorV/PorQ family protein [Ignavibacteriaceae bacterium]|nr:PorV/PorQ family protein [Ignavibacteriaceae bacterium]
MLKKILFVILSTIIFIPYINAQTVWGKYAGEFMAIGVGGRPLGMGGAYVAVANDVTAGYYNPAALARINYPQIELMHDERFGSLENYDYAAVAIPYGKDMSFGLSIIRLGVDGIPDTRNALYDPTTGQYITDINNPNARLDVNQIKQFSDQDWAFYLTFAKRYSEKFYYGANVKIIHRNIAEYSATGIGFDIGAWYTPFENFALGLNLQDITTTLVAWSTGRNELISPTAKVGAAYQVQFLAGTFTPAVDCDIRFENRQFASEFYVGPVSFDMHAGLEYSYKNIISVRAGYNDVKQFTIGAGVKLPKLNIDYSFARFSSAENDLGNTHRITLTLTLEEPKFLRKGL